MTNEEYSKGLSSRISGYEILVKDCKQMLSDSNVYNYSEWFKDDIRFMKNFCEGRLKEYINEKVYCNHGLNPPYCYPVLWRFKI